MAEVIDLREWRRRREGPLDRLEQAVARVDRALADRARRRAPAWLRDEIAAIRRRLNEGALEEAAARAEGLAERLG